jgi:hypothetical protein
MKNKMRKGQAAMEFLMTYGWAILVVLAAIGALAYFGVLSPDKFMPSKCMVSGGFSCVEYKLDAATHEVRFYLQNNLGSDADSVNVMLTDTNGANCTNVTGGPIVSLGSLTNGQKSVAVNFTDDCIGLGATSTASSFKGNINVIYVKSGETESHSASGSISGKFD